MGNSTTSNEPYGDGDTNASAAVSAEQKASRAATLQVIREGTPAQVQQAFADSEARGDIVRATEWDDTDAEESEPEDAMDGELSLADEDDSSHEGWDDDPSFRPDVASRPGECENVEDEIAQDTVFELLIRDGICRLERPQWMRCRAASPRGQDELDEGNRRLLLLEGVAQWLNEHRREFLQNADPWFLGCEALAELRVGYASVSPGDFLDLANLRSIAGESLFSRNKKATALSWEDGTQSLEFLFGDEARKAWVANAVAQFAVESGLKLSIERLKKVEGITVPKKQRGKAALSGQSVDALDLGQFIVRANFMAGTKWENVLTAYRERLNSSIQ